VRGSCLRVFDRVVGESAVPLSFVLDSALNLGDQFFSSALEMLVLVAATEMAALFGEAVHV